MTQTYLLSVILVSLLLLNLTKQFQFTTPKDWTENNMITECENNDGFAKTVLDQTKTVFFTDEYIYLKTSNFFFYDENTWLYTKNVVFRYYVKIETTDDTYTNLQISFISSKDGSKITQSILIQNTYEFIDADGLYCLLKQTDKDGNILLTLYSYDTIEGATNLLKLSSINLDTYPNQIFKSVSSKSGNQYHNTRFRDIIGLVESINIVTNETIVRSILLTGLGQILYKFTMSNVNSKIYFTYLLGLQISGNEFYTYLCSPVITDQISLIYGNDQTAISTSSGLFSNHIVISFLYLMMIATYDDNGQNGNIFFLIEAQRFWTLSLSNMKTTLTAPTGSLQYFTDYYTYIIELNLDPNAHTFYVVWGGDEIPYNYTFLNSLGDNKNTQIINDFTNQIKIASNVYGEYINDFALFVSNLHIWIYNTNSVIKYIVKSIGYDYDSTDSTTINKEFTVTVQQNENFLIKQLGSNFQVTMLLKCVSLKVQVVQMICFYLNDKCTFTVQTVVQYSSISN